MYVVNWTMLSGIGPATRAGFNYSVAEIFDLGFFDIWFAMANQMQ